MTRSRSIPICRRAPCVVLELQTNIEQTNQTHFIPGRQGTNEAILQIIINVFLFVGASSLAPSRHK